MRQIRKRKGFVLLLVVALIPLIGMAAMILASNSRILFTSTRRNAIKMDAQLACESGLAWLGVNSDKTRSISHDLPVVLEIENKDKVMTCSIKPITQMPNKVTFLVTGYANDKRFSYEYKTEYTLSNEYGPEQDNE